MRLGILQFGSFVPTALKRDPKRQGEGSQDTFCPCSPACFQAGFCCGLTTPLKQSSLDWCAPEASFCPGIPSTVLSISLPLSCPYFCSFSKVKIQPPDVFVCGVQRKLSAHALGTGMRENFDDFPPNLLLFRQRRLSTPKLTSKQTFISLPASVLHAATSP